jgi:GTP-binding protein
LLSRLTAAKPKIGDYPFTTLTPNLGVAGGDGDRYVVADVPGLIEGASGGRGLGHRFLRHVVRCSALVLVVDLSAEDPTRDLRVLRDELAAYDASLASRPSLVVGAKADLVDDPEARVGTLGDEAIAVSSTRGEGLDVAAERIAALAREAVASQPEREPHVVLRPGRPRFTIDRDDAGRWRVRGRDVERWVAEANLDDDRSIAKLQERMKRSGIDRRLTAMGARPGDEVLIRGRTFEYVPDDAGETDDHEG